jgi:hypothetical protein
MRITALPAALGLLLSVFLAAGPQAAASTLASVSEPYPVASAPCVDTTVRSVAPRLTSDDPNEHYTHQDFVESGVNVTFNTKIGRPMGKQWAEVVHYGGVSGNNVMMNEHPGDKVRVCYLGGPQRDAACNPDEDSRGRVFSVYDYKQHASYSGINSEHDCGGA